MKPIIKKINNKDLRIGHMDGNVATYYQKKVWLFLQHKGKELFGKEFSIPVQDQPLIQKIIFVLIRDKVNCDKFNLHFKKGIFLTGPVGVGKTSITRLLPLLLPKSIIFNHYSCRNIAFEYNQKGAEVIQLYAQKRFVCFDDLGAEATGRFYGKDCNTMAEIILSRYDFLMAMQAKGNHHFQTIITTNLTATEVEERYGERVRSRIRQLFNLFAYPTNAKDKRK